MLISNFETSLKTTVMMIEIDSKTRKNAFMTSSKSFSDHGTKKKMNTGYNFRQKSVLTCEGSLVRSPRGSQ